MFVAFPYLKELNRQRYLVQLSLQMRTHTYGHILECETQELVVTGDSRSMSTRHLVINVAEVYWREKEKGASPCFLLQGVCVCVCKTKLGIRKQSVEPGTASGHSL